VEAVRGEGGPHGTARIAEVLGVPVWALVFVFARFPILAEVYDQVFYSCRIDLQAAVVRAALGHGRHTVRRKLTKRESRMGKDGTRAMVPVGEVEEVTEKELPPDPALAKFILSKHPHMKVTDDDGRRDGPPVQININPNFIGG